MIESYSNAHRTLSRWTRPFGEASKVKFVEPDYTDFHAIGIITESDQPGNNLK